MHVVRKVTVLAMVAVLAVALGALRPGQPAQQSEADFPVGGIGALPSSLPAVAPIPGMSTGVAQTLPAIAPASGPGSFAIVSAFCERDSCPKDTGGNVLSIDFSMSKVYPPGAPVAASFTVNGQQTLVCQDDTSCDLTDWELEGIRGIAQHVAVGLTGGGENEMISVTACDRSSVADQPGDCRSVMVMFVETIFVLPAAGVADAPAVLPTFVSYRCDDVGLYRAEAGDNIVPPGAGVVPASPEVTWEEVFAWFYGEPAAMGSSQLRTPDTDLPLPDMPFYSCGGDTDSPIDDRVNFETDLGILSVESMADGAATALPTNGQVFVPMGTLSVACDVGDSVDVLDHPGPVVNVRGFQNPPAPAPPATFCDLDFAPNGVVTYTLWGTGETGVATVTGQQSGGGGVLRTGYPSFAGLAAMALVMDAPEVIGLEGGEFSVVLIDADFRFIGGQTIGCLAEPLDAVLSIIPQTGTSGAFPAPFAYFTLFPTRSAVETGVDVTITCALDSNPDVKAVSTARIGKPVEAVDLVAACNPIASTWPDGTPVETVAEAVSPADALDAIWALDPESGEWQGYSPDVPEASDLTSVNELGVITICMNAAGTISRPEI